MAEAVGIDLGTTNSVISIYRRGRVEKIPVNGRATMPSVVAYKADGKILVGAEAKSRLSLDPANTIASVKRSMGDPSKQFHVGNKVKTPLEVSADILRELKSAAEEYLKETVTDAVISVPAYFNDAQRKDTREAGILAGFNVLRMLPEPTAAAIAYGFNRNRNQKLLVYDLGGGTFDVSILDCAGNDFEVKGLGGDPHLGGDDFDEKIIGWILRKFHESTGINVAEDPSTDATLAMYSLREVAERAKIALSVASTTEIEIPNLCGRPFNIDFSLADYNQLIEPLVYRTVDIVNETLKKAQLTIDDISRIILVGGSTKNQLVKEVVRDRLRDPYVSEYVDEVVSHGAAIMAAHLSNLTSEVVPMGPVKERTAHTLGIDVVDRTRTRVIFKPIIKQQTIYPCRSGFVGVADAGQRFLNVGVFRGDNQDPSQNEKLGELEMHVSFVSNREVWMLAVFELDHDGIIIFTAYEFSPDYDASRILSRADNEGCLTDVSIIDTINPSCYRSKTIEVRV